MLNSSSRSLVSFRVRHDEIGEKPLQHTNPYLFQGDDWTRKMAKKIPVPKPSDDRIPSNHGGVNYRPPDQRPSREDSRRGLIIVALMTPFLIMAVLAIINIFSPLDEGVFISGVVLLLIYIIFLFLAVRRRGRRQ